MAVMYPWIILETPQLNDLMDHKPDKEGTTKFELEAI